MCEEKIQELLVIVWDRVSDTDSPPYPRHHLRGNWDTVLDNIRSSDRGNKKIERASLRILVKRNIFLLIRLVT